MTKTVRAWVVLLAGLGAALSAAGCGVKAVPTKGVLTVAGKPLAKATVMFVPEDPTGTTATGMTDAGGAFELTTFKSNDGALPGTYKVTILHSEPVELPPGLKTPEEVMAAESKAPRQASTIPEQYTRPDQTPLKHRVPQDGDAKIDIPAAK